MYNINFSKIVFTGKISLRHVTITDSIRSGVVVVVSTKVWILNVTHYSEIFADFIGFESFLITEVIIIEGVSGIKP